MAFSASGITGHYQFNGQRHALELDHIQVANGQYRGQAILQTSSSPTLNASLSGTVNGRISAQKKPLSLDFTATVNGPLTALLVNAALQLNTSSAVNSTKKKQAAPAAVQPTVSVTALITPWSSQPVPQAEATFRDLDLAVLWLQAPQTQLTGSAKLLPRPDQTAPTSLARQAWSLQLHMSNRLAGPWNKQRLPLESLSTVGQWQDGVGMIESLEARLGGGLLMASGQWSAPSPNAGAAVAPHWRLQAALKQVNPAALHTQFAALPLNGQANLTSQGDALIFNARMAAASPANQPGASNLNNALKQLHLRDVQAIGSWNSKQAGGTLALSSLRVRTDDAELSGEIQAQPAVRGGKGRLSLTAPGLVARLQGELQPNTGKGDISLKAQDARQALSWLLKLPGVPASIQTALQTHAINGNAGLDASWQGGWLNPTIEAQMDMPLLDWRDMSSPVPVAPNVPSAVLKLRAVHTTLSGRLSQMQLTSRAQIETGQRRYAVQLIAEAGRVASSAGSSTLNTSNWQGRLKQLTVSAEDPSLSAGAWQFATRGEVPLKWTSNASGGVFESGAGEALLRPPVTSKAPISSATLLWQPVRWRAGELTTAGKITNLPMAWIELLAGPSMAGVGLSGNMVFEGQWDARVNETLALKASLIRSSGDITLQSEGITGTQGEKVAPMRITAGVRQARLTLESVGDALTLALLWDSERAGRVEGQLKTRLARTPALTGESPAMNRWDWPADAPLNAQLRAQLPRIGVWSVLAPPGWRLRGSLGVNITIDGTRASPQMTGDLLANDLALRSVVDGIELGNGRLRATLDGTRMHISEFTLQGAGDKGTGGTLTAQGEAAWVNGQPAVQLDAQLDRLRASLRKDRQVTLSGNLRAQLDGNLTQVSGALKVDHARIALPEEGTPQLSDDVVVRNAKGQSKEMAAVAVGKNAPSQTAVATTTSKQLPQKNRLIKVSVQLDLGQDFRVQGKGIDTLMRGTLAVDADSPTAVRLVGTVNTFAGQYRAYGQRLDVEQGILSFTGAIDNPSLNILAIRPNLTQRVGVQITGTALLPRVRLYAQPDLPDAEKLSWLIVGRTSATGGAEAALLQQAAIALLGSKSGGMSGGLAASLGLDELSFRGPSSQANGMASEGAITLGKRFSRNFYAAYERSISGALGTLYIFYDLSQRFTVRAQSGQQSAVDLIFTVPYD